MPTGKFPHETLRRAILRAAQDWDNAPYTYFTVAGRGYRNWRIKARLDKLMRKWWARVIGAKKSAPGKWPNWLPPAQPKSWAWYEKRDGVSIKYQKGYRKNYTIEDAGCW